MAASSMTVAEFVSKYNSENGRGCPVGVIRFVGMFTAKEIEMAETAGDIQAGKGSKGGWFAGQKPAPVAKAETLKAKLAAFVEGIANGMPVDIATAQSLIIEYKLELARRAESQKS